MQAPVAGLPALAAQFDVGAGGLEGLLTLDASHVMSRQVGPQSLGSDDPLRFLRRQSFRTEAPAFGGPSLGRNRASVGPGPGDARRHAAAKPTRDGRDGSSLLRDNLDLAERVVVSDVVGSRELLRRGPGLQSFQVALNSALAVSRSLAEARRADGW